MDLAHLILWAALNAQVAVTPGATLDAGPYPASVLCRAYEVATARDVDIAEAEIGAQVVWLGRPLVVGPTSKSRVNGALLAAGLRLVEFRPPGREPTMLLTRSTDGLVAVPSPPKKKLATRIVSLEHAATRDVVETLRPELERLEKNLPDDIPRSLLVPDPRTGKLIVRAASTERLDEIEALIRALDTPPEGDRPKLEVFACRFQRASSIVQLFQDAWKKQKRPPVRLVAHDKSNSILVRCPRQFWPEILELLKSLDVTSK